VIEEKSIFSNKEFDLRILFIILGRHWISPLMIIILFGLGSFLYLRYTKPIYKSTSTLQIIEEDKVGDVLGRSMTNQQSTDLSKEIELLRSDVLFKKSIQNLQLETSIFSEGKVVTKDLYRSAPFEIIIYRLSDSSLYGKRIDLEIEINKIKMIENSSNLKIKGKINEHISNKHFDIAFRVIDLTQFREAIESNKIYFTFNNFELLSSEFHKSLTVNPLDVNAKTIEISYEHFSPRLSYDIVNSIINTYLNYEKDTKQTKATKTIAFINQQLDSLSKILRVSKDSINDFQRTERIPDIEGLSSNLSNNLEELNKRISSIDEELSILKLIYYKIQSEPNRLELYKLIPEMIGKKSFEGSILNQIDDLNKILEQKDDLLRDVTKENSKIKFLDERIQNRIYSIKKSMNVIEERIRNDKTQLLAKINEVEGKYYELPEKKNGI
jgi:uncharacterized protein involved in exopolysaccharide biosynthesis